ncbi:hypothetical protein QSJ18_04935 [Gordonia sp. ABSL1-1]|uniref:hypothetical protein n=1 Tax=Gordonia sp. ABSL1-1 TaxID=3053923 RepID=UPI0025726711|nr:hypothetical protein [Gordonia sp. ABSL1-1]MDL9936077.1 hypothetical protein [Gordonia sp. ABSL1-1]
MIAGSAGLLALASTIPALPPLLRLALLAPLVVAGLGAAVAHWVEVPAHLRPAAYPAIGLAAPIALATCLLWLRSYSAAAVTVTLALVCLLCAAARLRSAPAAAAAIADTRNSLTRTVRTVADSLRTRRTVPVVGALAIWAVGLILAAGETAGLFGLLATPGGILIAVATVVVVVSVLANVVVGDVPAATAGVIATIVIIRLPATLLTDAPIYAWTYKHIGLVDYVQQTGALPASYIDIYTRWPGFFAGGAWLSSSTGIDPVDVAHWFAPAIHALLAAGVWSLARALSLSPRAAILAVAVAEIVNWVGQDYYAPQAVCLVLAVATLALLADSRTHSAAALLAIPVFAAIVISHQLTPIWVVACAVLLTLSNRVRPLWLPIVLIAVWVAYVVPRLSSVLKYGLFTGSNPVKNAQTNIGAATGDSTARALTEAIDRGVAFAVWGAALLAFVYLWRIDRAHWSLPIVAFSPILLLAGQSYGGEAIFRVYLYSVIGCAILIGAGVTAALTGEKPGHDVADTTPRPSRMRARTARLGVLGLLLASMAVGALHGYYSGWAYNVITPSQVALSRQMLAQAQPSTIIVRMAPAGWPERPSGDYVRIAEANPGFDRPLVFLKNSLSRGFPTEEDISFMNNLGRMSSGGFYLVLPRQISTYSDYFGYFRPHAIESLIARLDREPRWRRAPGDDDTIIFEYVRDSRPATADDGGSR